MQPYLQEYIVQYHFTLFTDIHKLVGWLIGDLGPFETVFQSISGRLPYRGGKGRGKQRRVKMPQQTPPAHNASAIGTCLTSIQIKGHIHGWMDG